MHLIHAQNALMDIDDLKTFIDVIQKGSFAAVARDRNIDPSSVSRAIANLEKELGLRLFQRSTRRLVPTEAGLVYYRRIDNIVEELEYAKNEITDLGGEVTGILRITVPTSFGLMHFSSFLPEFLNMHPYLSVEVLMTNSIIDLLEERVDVALRLAHLDDSSLIAQKLFDIDYVICATEKYLSLYRKPVLPEDLLNHNCLIFPIQGYSPKWKFKSAQGQIEEIEVKGKCSITNSLAIKQCVKADLGIALLPRWTIERELGDNSLIALFPNYNVTSTDFNIAGWLIYPSKKYLPHKVRVFIDYITDVMHQPF